VGCLKVAQIYTGSPLGSGTGVEGWFTYVTLPLDVEEPIGSEKAMKELLSITSAGWHVIPILYEAALNKASR